MSSSAPDGYSGGGAPTMVMAGVNIPEFIEAVADGPPPEHLFHKELWGYVDFCEFPQQPRTVEAPNLPKEQMSRLFFGQMPYSLSEECLNYTLGTIGRCSVHHHEKIVKRGKKTGCLHAYCHPDMLKQLQALTHKALFDEGGFWFPRNHAQRQIMDRHIKVLVDDPSLRSPSLPLQTMTIEEATSTYVPFPYGAMSPSREAAMIAALNAAGLMHEGLMGEEVMMMMNEGAGGMPPSFSSDSIGSNPVMSREPSGFASGYQQQPPPPPTLQPHQQQMSRGPFAPPYGMTAPQTAGRGGGGGGFGGPVLGGGGGGINNPNNTMNNNGNNNINSGPGLGGNGGSMQQGGGGVRMPAAPQPLHYRLHNLVDFHPFQQPTAPRPPIPPRDQLVRMFVGQLPYNISDEAFIESIRQTSGGSHVYCVERILKRGRPAGCLYTYCAAEQVDSVLSVSHRILFDDGGYWAPSNDVQATHLQDYLTMLAHNEQVRPVIVPWQTMTVEISRSHNVHHFPINSNNNNMAGGGGGMGMMQHHHNSHQGGGGGGFRPAMLPSRGGGGLLPPPPPPMDQRYAQQQQW